MRLVLSALLLNFVATSVACGQHPHVSTPSSWTLSLAESNFGGGPAEKSDHLIILIDTDKWQKWSDTLTDVKGKTWHYSWSGPANGAIRPVAGMAGMKYSVDSTTDTSTEIYADGTIRTCRFFLSTDRKKFIETCTAKPTSGKEFSQTLVFYRTK